MATVHLPSGWTPHTGGVDEVTIAASRVDELIATLVDRFPPLRTQLEQVAIAIDGQIFHHARYEPLRPDSDVYFLPPVAGGEDHDGVDTETGKQRRNEATERG